MRGLWVWRAFNEGRERICDSGSAIADSAAGAESVAQMCLGGPHARDVVEIEVELVARGEALSVEERRAEVRARDERRGAFVARRSGRQ